MSDNTAATGLPCPRCRVDLVMSDRQGIEIDYCPKCRGVWLDRGELDKIIGRNAQYTAAPPANPPPVSPWTAPPPGYPPPAAPPGWGEGYEPGGHGGHGGHRDRGYRRHGSFLGRLFDD